jgi:hypothetical protein
LYLPGEDQQPSEVLPQVQESSPELSQSEP